MKRRLYPELPFHQARCWHDAVGSHWTFEQVVAAHAEWGGCVHATPEVFVLARPVEKAWAGAPDLMTDPQSVSMSPDCWHVWLLAGDIRAALKLLPYPLPWVSWHRRDKLRVHRLDHVLQSFAP